VSSTIRSTCAACGLVIEYRATRSSWIHSSKGADHAPVVRVNVEHAQTRDDPIASSRQGFFSRSDPRQRCRVNLSPKPPDRARRRL
jgi:hypothetical protein